MRRFWSWLLAFLLVIGVLVGFPVTPTVAQATPAVSLHVAPKAPVQGASFVVSGTLPTQLVRPVSLQVRSGKSWRTVAKGATTSKGLFKIRWSTPASSVQIQVVASMVTIRHKRYARTTTKTITVHLKAIGLSASPATPIVGERLTLSGTFPTPVVRPITVQYKSGKSWRTLAATKTNSKGRFAVATTAKTSRVVYRAVGKSIRIRSKSYPQLVTASRTVSATKQSVTLSIPASASVNQQVKATIVTRPARANRPVQVQVKSNGSWKTLASSRSQASGSTAVLLVAKAAGKFTYRANTSAWNGAGPVASTSHTLTVKPDHVEVNPDARPLSTAETSSISSYTPSSGTVVLSDPPATSKTITTGNIITIPPRTGATSGALVKVTKITTGGGKTTLTTTPATLPQVITNVPDSAAAVGLSVISSSFTPTAGVTASQLPHATRAIRGLSPQAAGTQAVTVGQLSLNVNKTVTASGFSASLTGSIEASPLVDLSFDTDWGQVKAYKIGAGLQVDNNLTAELSFAAKATKTIALGTLDWTVPTLVDTWVVEFS